MFSHRIGICHRWCRRKLSVASEYQSGDVVSQTSAASKKCGGNEACSTLESARIDREAMTKGRLPRVTWEKIVDVHFRNVSGPLPHFVETFPDEGYVDMYQVMKALREVRFAGTVVPDHVPQLVGDQGIRRAGTAYCIAYMRGLLRRANEEVG